jgi:hypothetical protein
MKNIAEIKQDARLMFTNVGLDGGSGWEHVSIAKSKKTPTWEEMCEIKSIFREETETVVQYHPSKDRYVNTNENCLHLWKPIIFV